MIKMIERDQEYDSFGPWIFKITESAPLPSLFIPHITRDETPMLSIKIPRNIERRVAEPGMNLYDYVVNLYKKDILILERVGEEVKSNLFLYEKIEALRQTEDLLQGNLHIAIKNNNYNLPFNSVSSDIIQELVKIVRQQYADDKRFSAMKKIKKNSEDDLSYFFSGLLIEEQKKDPEFNISASQIETSISVNEPFGLKKLIHGVAGKRLLESLHLTDGRELKILSRGYTYRYRGHPVYRTETLHIPIGKLTGITWEDDPKSPAVVNMILKTENNSYCYAFIIDNTSIYSYAGALKEAVGFSNGIENLKK